MLDLRVCEPALGSGAFLVEAINQLAAQYLTRRQKELGRRIDPEAYAGELQKVKAYLALHNCYGVDLNATAVELAEITLWLDAMHPGLRAPWFGLHLRRGNSLIGGRRETWTPAQLAKRGWLTTVPTARPLGEPVAPTEVHHFLLPAAGWGAVADTKEAKEGRPTATAALKAWRRTITGALTSAEQKRLQALGAAGRGAVGAGAAPAGGRGERDPPPHRRVGRRRPAGGHGRGAARADRGQPDRPEQRVPPAAAGCMDAWARCGSGRSPPACRPRPARSGSARWRRCSGR